MSNRISYTQIYEIISKVLDRIEIKAVQSLYKAAKNIDKNL